MLLSEDLSHLAQCLIMYSLYPVADLGGGGGSKCLNPPLGCQVFHFLTSRYEYANERVDDVIASLFAISFVHKSLNKYNILPITCDSMFLISRYLGVKH